VNSGTPDVSILISKGDGTFQPPAALLNGLFSISGTAVVGDFDRDGKSDIALLTPPRIQIWRGRGDGTFQVGDNLAFDGLQLVAADLNRDGFLDLVGVSPPFGAAVVALGRGDGTFEPQQAFAAGNLPTDIGTGDFNSDGVLDLVLCHQSEATFTVLLDSTPVPVIPPNGVVSAATFATNQLAVAPGEIITIFGRNLGLPQLITARLRTPEFLDTTPTSSTQARNAGLE
jgi:hypothetical protein